jgi:hypothetical protein
MSGERLVIDVVRWLALALQNSWKHLAAETSRLQFAFMRKLSPYATTRPAVS